MNRRQIVQKIRLRSLQRVPHQSCSLPSTHDGASKDFLTRCSSRHLVRVQGLGMGKEKRWTNWSANITYAADVVHEVTSVAQIQALLKSQLKVKPFGTSHTFNSITDTPHCRLSLKQPFPDEVLHLDTRARTVTISAGVRYDELCPYLHSRGFALATLVSVTELCVVGACSTAAHGSGDRCSNAATAVAGLEMVTGGGDVLKLSRHDDDDGDVFAGAVVGLGALGIITKLTLDVEPQFSVRQWVYTDLPLMELQEHFEEIMSCGYSVSLFTDWQGQRVRQVWVKIRDDGTTASTFSAPETFFGAKRQRKGVSIRAGAHFEHCTEQMGVPGPSHERLPHFRPGFLLPIGHELQTEYFLPRHHAVPAILAVETLRDLITPHLFISEIRSIARDQFWMSPCYGRDSVSIHFTWMHHENDVKVLLPLIERVLAPFDPRPHWGKLFAMPPVVLQRKYVKLEEFRKLAERFDSDGKLRNEFLDRNVFSRQTAVVNSKL